MLDNDEIDYNILEKIKQEKEQPEIINYNKSNEIEVSKNTSKNNQIKRIYSGKRSNTGQPDSLQEIITFSSNDLMEVESKLYDEDGDLKTNDEVLDSLNGGFRNNQIYNEALVYGINSGLYAKTFHYKKFFEDEDIQGRLDEIFIFDYFTLFNGRVQSPILVESKDIFMKKSDQKSHEIKQSYMFKEQAKIITSPKDWRTYLYPVLNVNKPQPPHELLVPRNEEEKKEWENGVKEGWKKGIKMAENNIIQKLRLARNDIMGMVRYKLVTQNEMIIGAKSSKVDIAVSSNSEGTSLNIGEMIFEINQLPKFNPDASGWKALPQIDDLIMVDDYE